MLDRRIAEAHSDASSPPDAQQDVRRSAIYARTSSPNQRDNYSADQQVNECWRHSERRGWTVASVFVDECKPGKTIDNRPKFQMMMAGAEAKEFDIVVFWKLDRFCRSLADLVNTERKLRVCNVELASVTEPIDTTTAAGRFNFSILGAVGQLESEVIGERSRLGLYGLAQEGRWPNRRPPMGYGLETRGMLTVDEREAQLIRRIFSDYIRLKSMPQIAFELNRDGIPSKAGHLNKWNARAVRDILSNTLYVGDYKVAGVTKHFECYRLIDSNLFSQVQSAMTRYKVPGSSRPPMPPSRKEESMDMIYRKFETFLSKAGAH